MSPRKQRSLNQNPVVQPISYAQVRQKYRLTIIAVSLLMMMCAIGVNIVLTVSHETTHRQEIRTAAVLADVRSFMTFYTTHDPFHANDYVDHVLEQATGEFAQEYRKKANDILLGIARGQATTGTVIDLGLERWTDDGGASVLVVTNVASQTPDGHHRVVVPYRCVVTAVWEGGQWKISSLTQVI